MDYFPAGLGALRQLCPENVPRNISNFGHLLNHYVHKTEEVACPEPRRLMGKPIATDTQNRSGSKQRSFLARQRWETPEILDIILSCNDDLDGDLGSPRQLGFLSGSPPLRTSNPLILDSKFEKGALPPSPLGDSYGAKPALALAAKAVREVPPTASGGDPRLVAAAAAKAERDALPTAGGCNASLAKPKREASPLLPASGVEMHSPSCGGKPRVRIEGFAPVTALA